MKSMLTFVRRCNIYALHNILLNTRFYSHSVPRIVVECHYFDLRGILLPEVYTFKVDDIYLRQRLPRYRTMGPDVQKRFIASLLNELDGRSLPGSAFDSNRFSLLSFIDYLIDFDYEKETSSLLLKFQEVARPLD